MKSIKSVFLLCFLLFSPTAFNSCNNNDDSTPAEICNDGIDNDSDGFTDCDDTDCNC